MRKKGVRVLSVTQPIGDDPAQTMLRQMIGMFDEYSSLENGKNVRRSMLENARQGFWNGTPAPLGFRIVDAEPRGAKVKKRLAVDPVEADLVRTIYDLYLNGLPGKGPLGVKNTVKVLNERGFRTRRGSLFGVGPVHNILTSDYYTTGEYPYGITNSKSGEANDPAHVVLIPIPKIIPKDVFDQVQQRLTNNNPKATPPRVVNGPCLLTGIAVCGSCGGGMTRTGTTRRGTRYSYYTCAGCHQKGETACKGRHIPMERLDTAVKQALKDRLFAPERLAVLLRSLAEQQTRQSTEVSDRIMALQLKVNDTEERIKRLYDAIESGVVELDETLGDRIKRLRLERDMARASMDRAKAQAGSAVVIDAEKIATFGQLMKDRMESGDVNAVRAYISSVVSSIEVGDDLVRIVGPDHTLRDAVLSASLNEENVRGFVRGWRAPQDSKRIMVPLKAQKKPRFVI